MAQIMKAHVRQCRPFYHEINWWKAHHRKQEELLLDEMTKLYSLWFNLSEKNAQEAVHFRVEAAKFHDIAEKHEDEGDIKNPEKYWALAEQALYEHFSIMPKFGA